MVRIIPIGNLPPKILETIASEFQEIARVRSKIMSPLEVPQRAFNRLRKQYDAVIILQDVLKSQEATQIDKDVPNFFVTDADVYYGGLNFIFGLYEPGKDSCLLSLARLRTEYYGQRPNTLVLTERAVKEAIHEIGHYLGFDHCRDPRCVMSFSQAVGEVDKKEKDFCRECKIKAQMRGVVLNW